MADGSNAANRPHGIGLLYQDREDGCEGKEEQKSASGQHLEESECSTVAHFMLTSCSMTKLAKLVAALIRQANVCTAKWVSIR